MSLLFCSTVGLPVSPPQMGAEHLPLVLDFFIKHALTDLDKTVIDHATKVNDPDSRS